MIFFPETIDTISTMSSIYLHTSHFLLELCTWTYSVQAPVLKPWRGGLPWLPAISTFCHVLPLPLSGLNWRSLSPLGGPGPSPSKMVPLFTGSAHTPLPGSGTLETLWEKSKPLQSSRYSSGNSKIKLVTRWALFLLCLQTFYWLCEDDNPWEKAFSQ